MALGQLIFIACLNIECIPSAMDFYGMHISAVDFMAFAID
jgi:hypothetical protein